jgi:hypothetical protein
MADRGVTSTSGQQQMGGQQIGSPISNEAYDVLTALQAKLEGLEACRKYAKDSLGIWQQLSDLDNQAVRILVGELERLVREGKLRPGTPGQSSQPAH